MTGMTHEELVIKAKKIARGLGYTNISTEYTLQINNYSFRLDVYATNDEGKTFGAECGNINGDAKVRIAALNIFLDDFFWLPYASTKLVDTSNTADETKEIIEEMKKERVYWQEEKEKMEISYRQYENKYNETIKLVYQKEKLETSILELTSKKDDIDSYIKRITELIGIHNLSYVESQILHRYNDILSYTKRLNDDMLDLERSTGKIETYAMRMEDLLIANKREVLTKECMAEVVSVISKHLGDILNKRNEEKICLV